MTLKIIQVCKKTVKFQKLMI